MTRAQHLHAAAILSLAIYLPTPASAGGPGSGRRCDPDDAVCTACKDCTRCRNCAIEGKSCSVMRDWTK